MIARGVLVVSVLVGAAVGVFTFYLGILVGVLMVELDK